MIRMTEVLTLFQGLEEAELVAWIERRWVRAEATPEGYVFQEVDVARVRLIVEMRECAVDDDALGLALPLLDQVYRLRRQLKALSSAVAAQPADVRERILAVLADREPR